MTGYDVIYSADDGFWYIEAYSRRGLDVAIPNIGKNEFDSKDDAIAAMTKHYPCCQFMVSVY